MAVALLILPSAKLTMIIRAIKDSYNNTTTLIATLMDCGVMHITSSKIQGLVHKNETSLCSELAAQQLLQEAFDGTLTGCRMTLAAFSLKLDKLIEPKKGTKTKELGFQAKARLVGKKISWNSCWTTREDKFHHYTPSLSSSTVRLRQRS